MDLLREPFFQVALPIIITLVISAWNQNKRMDEVSKRVDDLRTDMNRRLDEIKAVLVRMESKLDDHEIRLTRVEERTSPLHR